MKSTLARMAGALAAVFATALPLAGADTEINLVQQADFKPVVMHGRPTAAFGWYLHDGPRYVAYHDHGKYVSGEVCFKLSFDNGAVTFTYPDPLNPVYGESTRPIVFAPRAAWPVPPASKYRTTARVKFDRGKLSLPAVRNTIRPAADWQQLDFTTANPFVNFTFQPAAGASFSFAKVKCIPLYPKIGGEIALPDGGKLTRFLLPENADYMTRWGIALWRGWFWQLTGVALPIETVKEVKPTPGAFALMKGKAAPGGWHLVVNKEGIVLTGNDERVLSPALFDYLRKGLGCAFYAPDCKKLPKDGSVKQLAAIDRTAKPKYAALVGNDRWMCMSGGIFLPSYFSTNDCDYYHLANPQDDHVLNTLMPMEMYFDKHPEYYMLDRSGKRVKTQNPYTLNPCFSSEGAMQLMVDNFIDYAQGQSIAKHLQFSPGDANTLCLCEKCLKFNGGSKSNTDAMIEYVNRLMPKLSKVRPDLIYHRDIYATHHYLPTHVKPATTKNVMYTYCIGHDVIPCTLHVDCAMNRPCLEELDQWAKLAGGPENLGYDTYRDVRPIHHLKEMEYLNRFGKSFIYMFVWKGYSPATAFTTARWNLGDDPVKLVEEFDAHYYGKGGKYVHEINLLVEEYAMNYKHTPEELNYKGKRHLAIWGGALNSRTLLDRKTFDKIYALFDKALEAAKDQPIALRHILQEKKFYLAEDLIRYNRPSCETDAELAVFSARLAELVRCARRAPREFTNILHSVPGRDFVTSVAGWTIPDTGKFWANEPAVEKFLADPASIFRVGVEKIPGGWYFKPGALKGRSMPTLYNYECPPRLCVALTRATIGQSSATAILPLDAKPRAPLFLSIEGLDDDKRGASLLKVEVNGHTLFNGPNTFGETEWSRMGFTIPAEFLKAGDNAITLTNVTPDTPSRSVRFTDPEEAKLDIQWGWIQISEMVVFDPVGDLAAFAAGAKGTRWRPDNWGLKGTPGTITGKDGKIFFSSGTTPRLRLSYFHNHFQPKITVPKGMRVRLTTVASGKGKAQLVLNTYQSYKRDTANRQQIGRTGFTQGGNLRGVLKSPEVELTSTPQTITHTFTLPRGAELVHPEIVLLGAGSMTVTKFSIDLPR